MLAQDTRTLQADGGPAGIIIGAGSRTGCIVGIAVARIVVSGHKINAAGICRIGTAQDSVNVSDGYGFWNARAGLLDKLVGLDLKAVATLTGIFVQLAFDPLGSGINPFTGNSRHSGGERLPGIKAGELFDGVLYLRRRDFAQRGGNLRIWRTGGY